MADELYRSEIIIDINDQDAVARAERVQKKFEASINRMQRVASVLGKERIAPVVEVRDRLTQSIFNIDKLLKRLDGEVAAPVITAKDEVTAAVTRMNEAVQAIGEGKHEVALELKTSALAQLEKAEKAVKAISQAKGAPYAELRGPLLEQLERTRAKLEKLDFTEVEPVAKLRDRLSSQVEKTEGKLKKLSLSQASPVLEVQDRVSAVVARINAALEAVDQGKVDVVADMKGPLMDEIIRAKEALGALGDVKTGPVAELRGELFGQLAKAQSLLEGLDSLAVQPRATLMDRVSAAVGWIGSRLTGLTRRVWTVTIRAKDAVSGTLRGIWRAVTSPLGMLGIGVGGAAITAGAIVKPLQLAGQMEQARIGFETMLGSAEKADKFLKDLQRFAALTPFEFPELQDASKRLLAFGFSAEEILPTMTAIGNAASGLGIGAEGIDRLILAIGQMRAKAKVSGEEMRQLTEAGIPAWDMLAKAMGKSTAEVMKMSEKGLIPAGQAIDILIKGMNERFPNMMERQSRSLLGLWSTIKDVFNMNILFRWGDGLSKAIKPRLERLVDLFTRNEDVTKRWGDTLERVAYRAGDRIMTYLERAFNTVDRLLKDPRFQKADLFGKTQILWDEIIAKPFNRWWNSGGSEWAVNAGTTVGATLAKTMVKAFTDVVLANPLTGAIAGAWLGGTIGGPIGALIGGASGLGWGAGSWLGSRGGKWLHKRIYGEREETPGTVLDLQAVRQMARETQRLSDTRQQFFERMTERAIKPELPWEKKLELPGLALPRYGIGGIVTRPQFSLVGEAGPEAIIPLARERDRALRIWIEAGRWLGADKTAGLASEKSVLRVIEGGASRRAEGLPVLRDTGQATSRLHGLVSRIAAMFRVPVALLKGLIQAESSWRTGVVSRVGAIGLTQVMPSTARSLGYDPAQLRTRVDLQIEAGARYLSQMLRRFKSIPLALAAYHAGPGAVTRHKGIPPYPETQAYVSKVMRFAKSYGLPGYAEGTIVTKPHVAMVAEEGPEAIIPLAPRLRLRALELWQETGRQLGVQGVVKHKCVPPYSETQAYVGKVLQFAKSYGLPGYARGTIATRPHIATVAEEGPEAIIPLTPRFRLRALELWQETGKYLGVQGFEAGGFTAPVPANGPRGGSGTTIVNIYMGEAVRTIQVNSQNDISKAADEVASIVARNLRAVLENLAS